MTESRGDDWVLLHEGERSFGWLWMTAETLRASGIPVRAAAARASMRLRPFPFFGGTGGGDDQFRCDRLFVPASLLTAAREIIDAGSGPQGVIWSCSACAEENPPGFGLCWNCETAKSPDLPGESRPAPPRILAGHAVLAVHDLDRSSRWLTELFVARAHEADPGNWVFVEKDAMVFMLGCCPGALAPVDLGDHQYFAYLVVDDVDELRKRARQVIARHGGAILKEPKDEPWGMRELALQMPEGHRLMLAKNLGRASPPYPRG